MEVTFTFFSCQTPCIRHVNSSSLENSCDSSYVESDREESEHSSTTFIWMIDPAVFDLEEYVFDEADGGL